MVEANKTHALVVGIDQYYNDQTLNRMELVNHAIDFAGWLHRKKVPPENITLCLSPLDNDESIGEAQKKVAELGLKYQDATLGSIVNLFANELSRKEGDLFFIFWVSHGYKSQGQRRLLCADGTANNSNNLISDTIIEFQKSDSFKIKKHICIIDACAFTERHRGTIGGHSLGNGDDRDPESRLFCLYSTREGERSDTNEQGKSYFCEAFLKELEESQSSISWLPDMNVIADNLQAKFEDLNQQPNALISQMPNRVDMESWNGDKILLYQNKSADSSRILQAIQIQSNAAREALTPRILDRISREVVRQKYLPAINRGLTGEQQRIIPIIGPAGYGKSTILGDIYDELTHAQTPWVGLILCSTISMSTDLYCSFGKSLCGNVISTDEISIVEIIDKLNTTYGRGLLLIDTIDLLINRSFVSDFASLLRQLMDKGATVVFTCRDHDYNDNIEPVQERLPGLAKIIDRHTVPKFTVKEICTAATNYFQKLDPNIPERGQKFADRLLAMTANNESLKDILENPLLLALLCDLSAKDGNVAEDLTVSKLYKRYWNEKISYDRLGQTNCSLLAIEKGNFCLTLSKVLFELSQERLCEAVFLDDLDISFTDLIANAYKALLSEKVIEHLPSGLPSDKLHFFHQTLMEYSIAYWLTRNKAKQARSNWLKVLSHSDSGRYRSYWYPVLRQYLTLIESEDEFTQLATEISMSNLAAFGAVAYAAVSRDRSDALRKLLPTALSLGDAYQKRLQQAIKSAPKQIILDTWSELLELMRCSNHAVAVNTAKMISILIERWWDELKSHLPEAMDCVASRSNTQHKGKDDRSLLMGWLVQQWLPISKTDAAVLAILRQHYFLLGHRTSISVIQLHQNQDVVTRMALLTKLLERELPNDTNLENTIVDFVAELLANSPQDSLIPDPLSFLEQSYPKRWGPVQARAVGRVATQQPDLMQKTLNIVLENPEVIGKRFNLAYGIIRETVSLGAISPSILFFCNLDLSSIHPRCSKAILGFLNEEETVCQLTIKQQDTLSQWLEKADDPIVGLALPLLDTLADDSLVARSFLNAAIVRFPTEQKRYQTTGLRFLPIEEQPELAALDKNTQLTFVRSYHKQLSLASTLRLLQASHSKFKDVAQQASLNWSPERIAQLEIKQIVPLLKSQFPAVGKRALTWLSQKLSFLSSDDVTTICEKLRYPNDPDSARVLCDLFANWIKAQHRVPDLVLPKIHTIMKSLVDQGKFDGAPAKPMIQALKAIGQSEDAKIDIKILYDCVIRLLTSIDLIKIPHSKAEMIDVLCAMVRISPTDLAQLVETGCPILVEKKLRLNFSTIIGTIIRVEGGKSAHFRAISESSWYCPWVEEIILESRNL
jgi:hypothetical protein